MTPGPTARVDDRGRRPRCHPNTPVGARSAAVLTVLGLLAVALVGSVLGSVAAPATAEAAPAANGPALELRVDDMDPRVVTAAGPAVLTVTGLLTNIGDEPITDVRVRPQRGDRLRTEGELRTALNDGAGTDTVLGEFTNLPGRLEPGRSMPLRLTVPLRAAEGTGLALTRTGVYPLLLTASGAPEDGARVRLGAVRMLLPVLGLPAAPGSPAAAPTPAPTAAAPADPADADPVTLLYPLADRPRKLPTGPGERTLLGDDDLAVQLAQGGRLDGLLGALEVAAPAGSPVREAICLAIDPDLLRTVRDMSGGYRVRGPDGTEVDGRGADVAGRWLARLRAVAAGRCVLALPFADADLVALSRAGLADLAGYAVADGARIVGEVLGTPVRADLTWPADGLLDERSLTDYLAAGGRTVVLSGDAVAQSSRGSASGGVLRLTAPRGRSGAVPTAVLADPLPTLAAGGTPLAGASGDQVGSAGNRLGSLSARSSVSPAGTGAPLSDQDLTGAVAFRALDTTSDAPLVIAPPHRWNTTGADARTLLTSVTELIAAGRFRATPLPPEPVGTSSAGLVYPLRAGAREVPTAVTGKLKAARDVAAELRSAAVAEQGVGHTPAQVFDPVTEGLLRASSATWRGSPADSTAATKVITDRVRLLRSLVRVLEPPSPYALGDREAPLPITLANGLPVAMKVRVALSKTPGLRTAPIAEQRIPPLGRLQLRVNTQLNRSGQFIVEAKLTTLNGVQLGPPSRLQLRSTAYGTITLWLTGTAGALLVVLAVRRITRRVRGAQVRPERSGLPPGSLPPGSLAPPPEPADDRPLSPAAPGHRSLVERTHGPFRPPPERSPNGPVRRGPVPDAAVPNGAPIRTGRAPRERAGRPVASVDDEPIQARRRPPGGRGAASPPPVSPPPVRSVPSRPTRASRPVPPPAPTPPPASRTTPPADGPSPPPSRGR